MGAWSNGPFDNDDAADFMMELEAAPSWDMVRLAFDDVRANSEYVELAEGARAYAGAALITVATGKSDISAQDYYMTLDAMGSPPDDLIPMARTILKRLTTGDSELRELYLDSGNYNEWIGIVASVDQALKTE
ncbi:hypothetical protein AEAC466_03165 [Asticcacaulis sp. AC466]|uniref:DUF4259 domain-containing protein n=1 Tax=Asticcacaulis sp. AC466 TaxID=1282362 RepID=UPI0003C3E58A|nr:DUF4259 domain-containing protein [Asticcacaulis sp. AC466]ESQ86209.1 hypothetical protein AEAC466_03165 [Asticcacaulis sp. AC466]